ncbi:hypothetical protein KM043_002822 [Ampulex compressa]|nr:hypothetical protein KM043_002822 [Ampulex compressa]
MAKVGVGCTGLTATSFFLVTLTLFAVVEAIVGATGIFLRRVIVTLCLATSGRVASVSPWCIELASPRVLTRVTTILLGAWRAVEVGLGASVRGATGLRLTTVSLCCLPFLRTTGTRILTLLRGDSADSSASPASTARDSSGSSGSPFLSRPP